MYLTGREQALVADIFKVLADSLPEHELRREVGLRLLDLLRADYLGAHVWDGARGQFASRVAVTPQLQCRRAAVRLTDVVPREAATRAEQFNDFACHDGLHWGLNLFAWTDGENIGDLRIWRGPHRANFSDHELALLDLVRPAFSVALARARAAAGVAKPAAVAAADRPDDADSPHDAFARLTRRERQVVELVVEGLLDKEIAQRLGISYTTVRTHLDRSFQKLGVSNRSRLARKLRPLAEGR